MASKKAEANNCAREQAINTFTTFLEKDGNEVLRVANNKIAIPAVNDLDDEIFIEITISIPSGERGGAPYDGHERAQDYRFNLEKKAKEKEEAEEKKKKKIKEDKKKREEEKEGV
jgi:hypothetical protein